MTIELIVIAGATIFVLSSLYFAFNKKHFDKIDSALLVSLITIGSYILFLSSLTGGPFTTFNESGEPLLWTRWIGYIGSCTLLMWHIASRVKIDLPRKVELMYLTGITMLTGALASVTDGWIMISLFALGGVTYTMMMYILWQGDQTKLAPIKKYIYFGWSVFPIVFLLSPEGFGVISTIVSISALLALDIFTKIIFYLEEKGA